MKILKITLVVFCCICLTAPFPGCDWIGGDDPSSEDSPIPAVQESALDNKAPVNAPQEEAAVDGVTNWIGDRLKQAANGGNNAAAAASDAADGTAEWANDVYKQLKDRGLTTANSAGQWVTEDYQSLGDWEYKIIKLDSDQSVEQSEKELNELGRSRWECFQVTAASGNAHYYFFKRPKKSYLKNIPLRDMLKLVPLIDNQ